MPLLSHHTQQERNRSLIFSAYLNLASQADHNTEPTRRSHARQAKRSLNSNSFLRQKIIKSPNIQFSTGTFAAENSLHGKPEDVSKKKSKNKSCMFCKLDVMERIDIKPIHLKNQKITEIRECFIELHDSHLYYKVDFLADEPVDSDDHDLGWNEGEKTNIEAILVKKFIAGIDKSITEDEKWVVVITSIGNLEVKSYYRSELPASLFFEKIKNWLLLTNG